MVDHLVQASQASGQSTGQTHWQRGSDLEIQIARLRFLNRTEVELARAISRMIDQPVHAGGRVSPQEGN